MIDCYHVIRLTQYVDMNAIFYFMKANQLLQMYLIKSRISSLKYTGIYIGFHHAPNTYFYSYFTSLLTFINVMNYAHIKY